MKKYIQIEEHCGNEGETWSTFLLKDGNEQFITKLKEAINTYEDELEDIGDYILKIKNDNIDETEVDIVVKYSISGYDETFTKCDKVINPNKIKVKSEEDFINSFYKRKLFN